MASNKRFLKAYARFDGSGRIVPASTILRKTKPKVGNWTEVQTYECCNPIEIYYTPTLPITYPVVRIYCDGSLAEDDTFVGTYTTISNLVTALNADPNTSQYGTFATGPNNSVKLTAGPFITDCTGVLSMTIIAD